MKDRISVAMTTYNGEKYLRQQLDSLYTQSLLPDEIIVVDDCSTDNTVGILEEYKNKYGLTYFINEDNIGYNKNFEKAITMCTGDYIVISDQDDIWFKNKIQVLFNKIQDIEVGKPAAVSSGKINTDSKLNKLKEQKITSDSSDYLDTVFNHRSQGCSMIINKKLIDYLLPFDNNVLYDYYIGLTAALVGNKYNLGIPLMYYRSHENNVFFRQKKPNLYTRKIAIYKDKFPQLFPDERFNVFKYVLERNINNIESNKLILMEKLIKLKDANILQSINIIFSIDYLKKRNIKIIIMMLVSKVFKTIKLSQN